MTYPSLPASLQSFKKNLSRNCLVKLWYMTNIPVLERWRNVGLKRTAVNNVLLLMLCRLRFSKSFQSDNHIYCDFNNSTSDFLSSFLFQKYHNYMVWSQQSGEWTKHSFFAICIHKATINYIHEQEDPLCFPYNHIIYLDNKQFMKITHSKLKQNVIKTFNQTLLLQLPLCEDLSKRDAPAFSWILFLCVS